MSDEVLALESASTPAHLAWLVSNGRWAFPLWLQYLNDYVMDFLLRPGQGFLAVEIPIRTGKSFYLSVMLPAWHVGMFPDKQVLLTSYSDSLSVGWGKAARAIIATHGPEIFGVKLDWNTRSQGDWKTEGHPGGMKAVARGGDIIGGGGDLIIIDDPIRNDEEANNRKKREYVWNWYQRTLRGRLEPNGKLILVCSRWHEEDLTGKVLSYAVEGMDSDPWERIHLPALATPAPGEMVEDLEAWRDILGRKAGDALWPERWPATLLRRIQGSVGPDTWNAQYQQVPVATGGEMFPNHLWGEVDAAPKRLDRVRRFDLADNSGAGDWAAASLLGRDVDGFTYVLDVRRIRAQASEVEKFVRQTAREDKERYKRVRFVVEQEPGSTGKTVGDQYVREHLAGYDVAAVPTSGDKVLGARPFAAQQQAGNVFLVRQWNESEQRFEEPPWWRMFRAETSAFPKGENDDMIDTASKAYNDLVARALDSAKRHAQVRSQAGHSIGGPV